MELYGLDAYSPKEIAERVENVGVAKARLPLFSQITLGVLAGGFIGLGALYFTLLTSDERLGFTAGRLLGGASFSLGLILVVVAGAELFTGNNLLVMAWAAGRIGAGELLRNWAVVFIANFVGALGLVLLTVLSNHGTMNDGAVGANAVKIAAAKTALPFWEAFFKGILCNVLVCLAVWLALAGRGVADKILAILFPISAFVAAGFEHSVANMYFIPLGILLCDRYPAPAGQQLSWSGLLDNLAPVTLGNVFGGGVMVALVYYLIYRRPVRGSEH
ncbi:MAG TPA: formate/nitrite transporter family protein [candidate division Zixibacteria bacterium]|nr:formate/nitrite transporter family protein [candidate division Zixibacteria bacterium]